MFHRIGADDQRRTFQPACVRCHGTRCASPTSAVLPQPQAAWNAAGRSAWMDVSASA